MPAVKPSRRYNSPRRVAQAGQTREAVLAAARDSFVAKGWRGTTIAGIATSAGVSKETIYATFGSKHALLEALVAAAVRGSAPDVPLLEQAGPQGVAAAGDQRTQLRLFSEGIAEILGRVAPLMAVAAAAAEEEPDSSTLHSSLQEGRRKNLRFVVDSLMQRDGLRVSGEQALAIIWRLASPELYLLVTRVEGLSAKAYAHWLAESLERLLLQ